MIKAIRLGFAEFASKDVERMASYYTEAMGYKVTDRSENGSVYLSNGLDHHNIVLTPSDYRGILHYGYQLDNKLSLKEVQEQLKQKGIHSVLKADAKPGIPEYLDLQDPDGNQVQLYAQMELTAPGFGTTGIVPLKLGHIAFYAKKVKECVAFYEEALGFWFTDKIDENFCHFMTCNTDHHVINIVASPHTSKLHHIAFQLKDASHHYASSDVLARNDIPVLWGPSRHTAGHNIATYHYDPDQNVVELYTDMDVYLPELGMFEPRPWHKYLPLKPRVWEGLSSWGTDFEFNLGGV